MTEVEMVTVPKALLAEVLENAENYCRTMAVVQNCAPAHDIETANDIAKIHRLREAAGITAKQFS